MLSSVFDSGDDLDILTQRFLKKVNGCIAMNFKKIRVNNAKQSDEDRLFEKMRDIKGKKGPENEIELDKVVKEIASLAEEKYDKVIQALNEMQPEEGKINSQKFWKLKRKMFPKGRDPSTAMMDGEGNLLMSNKLIEDRALKVYTERLEGNKILEHLKSYEDSVNKLCEIRLRLTKDKKTMDELNTAIKDLDTGKARDALGHANELFKDKCAGSDFKLATLKFMNHIKKRIGFPKH